MGGWPMPSPHPKAGALPFSRSWREGGAFRSNLVTARLAHICASGHASVFIRHSGELTRRSNLVPMPLRLKRYQQTGDIHFVTFSCYRRAPLLGSSQVRDKFVITLERVRRW